MANASSSFFAKVKSLFGSSVPDDGRKSVPVHVLIRTAVNDSPQVLFYGADLSRAENIQGHPLQLKQAPNSFTFEANERDRSISRNRIPKIISFGFKIFSESTTLYQVNFFRKDLKNYWIDLLKYAPSEYPESTGRGIFRITSDQTKPPEKLNSYLIERAHFLNDFVHPWKITIEYRSPGENLLPEYFIEVNEVPKNQYLNPQQLEILKTPEELTSLAGFKEDLFKANLFHVSLFHWAVRTNNLELFKNLFNEWLKSQPAEVSPYNTPVASKGMQGAAFTMATRAPQIFDFLAANYFKQNNNIDYQSGLEIGHLAAENDLLTGLPGPVARILILSLEGYNSLLDTFWMDAEEHPQKSLKVFNLLPMEERVFPFQKESFFDPLMRNAVRTKELIDLYKSDIGNAYPISAAANAGHISKAEKRVQSIDFFMKEVVRAGGSPTPLDLIHYATDMFESKGDTFILKSFEKVKHWREYLFASENIYKEYYELAKKDPTAQSRILYDRYNELREANKVPAEVARLAVLKNEFIKAKDGYTFQLKDYVFVKLHGRMYIQKTPLK